MVDHLKNDDHHVTVRNDSSRGMCFESDEAAPIGSFIVLSMMAANEKEALACMYPV
jgi:hypothetical protein